MPPSDEVVIRKLNGTEMADSTKREGERGAEYLLDGGEKRHPRPLPAPEGEDEQV